MKLVRLVLAGALLAGCREATHDDESEREQPPAAVTIATVKAGTIDDVLAVAGDIQAVTTVRLSTPIAGRLTDVAVQPGDAIRKGGVVARVISLENEAALNGLELLRRSDAAGVTADVARSLRGRDVAVRSPIDGRVSARLHAAGEQVAAGDVLLEAFDPRTVVAVVEVPMASLPRIHPGLAAEVVGASFSARARVEAIVPAAAASTVGVPVRVALEAPPAAAVLHEPVSVRIWLAAGRAALLVPRSAIVSSTAGTTATVVVPEDGKARRRTIEIGARTDTEIEVVSGLAAGAPIVTEGGYGLADGAAIRPAEARPRPGEER